MCEEVRVARALALAYGCDSVGCALSVHPA